ncbi:hypothetical protein HDV01_007132, partial [Terramyces sp. JEL0728]
MEIDDPILTRRFEYKNLPMSYEFEGESFYVRDCYDKYYQDIIKILQRKKYISLTGTPGIGKSVFYIYFFQRYRKENPDITIVTASFNKKRQMKKCMVFKPNIEPEEEKELPFPAIKDALHLYDGPPNMEPSDNKLVCFTSPNFDWFRSMEKQGPHIQLYMSTWDSDELLIANDELNLGIRKEVINERYLYVGGVPRYCLCLDDFRYEGAANKMLDKITKINSFVSLADSLQYKGSNPSNLIHRIFHFVPVYKKTDYYKIQFGSENVWLPVDYKLQVCSEQIRDAITDRIQEMSDAERKNLVQWLKGDSKSATILGWLFEGFCNEFLKNGRELELHKLSDNNIVEMTPDEIITLPANSYVKATSGHYESVDGWWYNELNNTLYLFQITINYHHPVNARGIIKLIKNNNWENQDIKVILIFVVPKGMSDYKRQNIIMIETPADYSTQPVKDIYNIGDARSRKLATQGIKNIGQLENALKKRKVENQDFIQNVFNDYMAE